MLSKHITKVILPISLLTIILFYILLYFFIKNFVFFIELTN